MEPSLAQTRLPSRNLTVPHPALSGNSVAPPTAATRRPQPQQPLPRPSVPSKGRTSRLATPQFLWAYFLLRTKEPRLFFVGFWSSWQETVPRSNLPNGPKLRASAPPTPRTPRIPADVPRRPLRGPPKAHHRDTPSPLLARKDEWMNSFPPSKTPRSSRQNVAQCHARAKQPRSDGVQR